MKRRRVRVRGMRKGIDWSIEVVLVAKFLKIHFSVAVASPEKSLQLTTSPLNIKPWPILNRYRVVEPKDKMSSNSEHSREHINKKRRIDKYVPAVPCGQKSDR